MKIEIRDFKASDQEFVKELILDGLAEHWGTIRLDLNPDLNDIATAYQDNIFLVAASRNRIIGCGALIRKDNITGEIVRMSVAKNVRRMGIGNMVLNALCLRARETGYRRLVLETTASWKNIRQFYEAFGFNYTHDLDDEFGGQAHYEFLL